MSNVTEILAQAAEKAALSMLTAGAVALVSLLSRTVRDAVFYKRYEFVLDYEPEWGMCQWNIQWDRFKVSIDGSGVRKEYIKTVIVKIDGTSPGRTFEKLEVSDTFYQLERLPVALKLNSIVRTRTEPGKDSYKLAWVLRRRRWK